MSKLLDKFSDIQKYIVAAILLAVPLYPKFPFLRVPGIYVSIRLEDFLIFLAAVVFLPTLFQKRKELLKNRIVQAIIVYLIISLASLLSAIFLTQTVSPLIGFFHLARRVEYLICFFFGLTVIKSQKDLAFYTKCILIVIVYAFIYGLGQKILYWPIITTQNDEYSKGVALRFIAGGHLVSTFAGHYDLASFMVFMLPLVFIILITRWEVLKAANFGNSKLFVKGILIAVFGSGLWLLVNTASRISIAAYALSITSALLLARKFKFIPIILVVSVIFVALSTNLVDRYVRIFEVYVKQIMSVPIHTTYAAEEVLGVPQRREIKTTPTPQPITVFEDRSTSIRLNVEWPRAIRALTKNPLLGTGFSSITLATDNDYLRALGEVGILGFAAFILIFWEFALYLLRNIRSILKTSFPSLFAISVVSGMLGIFVNALFIDIFEASKFAILFWLILGFCVKAVELAINNEKTKKI